MTPGLLLGLLLAQSAPAEPAPSVNLDRIRRALAEPAPTSLVSGSVDREGPIFRMRIEAFELKPAWTDRRMVPAYVRPWFRSYHHEHLEQVTPVEFRGATLHPYGLPIDVMAGYLVKEIKAAHRRSQEKRARKIVSEELAALLACRADPTKPGC